MKQQAIRLGRRFFAEPPTSELAASFGGAANLLVCRANDKSNQRYHDNNKDHPQGVVFSYGSWVFARRRYPRLTLTSQLDALCAGYVNQLSLLRELVK